MIYNPFYFSTVVVYMLQNTEYHIRPYLTWLLRTKNFKKVMYRRVLDRTRVAKMLRLVILLGMSLQLVISVVLFVRLFDTTWYGPLLAVTVCLSTPYVWAVVVVVPLWLGRVFISNPKERRLINESASLFKKHPAHKIVVAGSYGKTTMKELLGSILSSEKKVAITPANKNVAISHALFVQKLHGDEDILVIELGEGRPGDVKKFCETIGPNTVFITGIAPAHLDQYASLEQAAQDIFSAAEFVEPKNVYVNGDSEYAKTYIKDDFNTYNQKGTAQAKVSKIKQTREGLSFAVTTKQQSYTIKTPLLGIHLVGSLTAALQLAENFGISKKAIIEAFSKLEPYEHRMKPRYLSSGALLLDDTYNGNIEGMQAGLRLLTDLPATRRIYVTPGLVDQGDQTVSVHTILGTAIAAANPDIVVLIKNSAQPVIESAMKAANYKGELRIEDDPLNFYTHIDDITANGDVVLLQNDWPDNYA